MTRRSGSFITETPSLPTTNSGGGIWPIMEASQNVGNGRWPYYFPSITYTINNSLRFRSSASAYLSRTPASASNRKTWTWSGWVKRSKLGVYQNLLDVYVNGSSWFTFCFNQSNNIILYESISGIDYGYITSSVFRDVSAWYHIILAVDTTQASASNRVKLYVNGVEQSFSQNYGDAPQNYEFLVNNNISHKIGIYSDTTVYLDGYLAEVNFIDGQALTPSSFGQTNSTTGVWSPKAYSGTYGTNGFYLKFNNTASTTTLGYDSSGNNNNWTTNNISLTAGATYDAMLDVPTPVSATVGNYAVLNAVNSALTVSSGNLNWAGVSSGSRNAFSSLGAPSGKWYFEANLTNTSGSGNWGIGLTNSLSPSTTTQLWNSLNGWYLLTGSAGANLAKYHNSTSTTIYSAASSIGAIIGVAFDIDAGKIWFSRNNVWLEGDPTTGTSPSYSDLSGTVLPLAYGYDSNDTGSVNFGQRPFAYTPPTGFKSLNTYNLSEPTIVKGNQYFDATLYTGNGSTQSITNSGFQPDLVWTKARSNAQGHTLFDSVRGASKYLQSNSTNAEGTFTAVPSFNTDGFTSTTDVSTSGYTYVGWQWKAGGTAVTNTAGSITSSVSANPTAGFSVVTFTCQSSGSGTIGHGLGVAPSMIISKGRGTVTSWGTYHVSNGWNGYLVLNGTNAFITDPNGMNNTAPTSNVWTQGSTYAGIGTMVAYCFAAIPGYSAFGSYTGNGSADGPFVYCGFRPRYILIKRTDSSTNGDWRTFDTSRAAYNVVQPVLFPNLSSAEDATVAWLDILSNGFKIRESGVGANGSGSPYIYAAFAENPFKYSLAR